MLLIVDFPTSSPPTRTHLSLPSSRCVSFEELEESEQFYRSQNRFVQLLVACYHFVAGHSDLLCYFIIILNNMVTASVISIVLPILIFLWAMLSIPRPSKSFWMTAIVYTEVGPSFSTGGGVFLKLILMGRNLERAT